MLRMSDSRSAKTMWNYKPALHLEDRGRDDGSKSTGAGTGQNVPSPRG